MNVVVVKIGNSLFGEVERMVSLCKELILKSEWSRLVILMHTEKVNFFFLSKILESKCAVLSPSDLKIMTNHRQQILDVQADVLLKKLANEQIVLVPSSQGLNLDGEKIFLEEEALEVSAVAVAVAIKAKEVLFYEGGKTLSPRTLSFAQKEKKEIRSIAKEEDCLFEDKERLCI